MEQNAHGQEMEMPQQEGIMEKHVHEEVDAEPKAVTIDKCVQNEVEEKQKVAEDVQNNAQAQVETDMEERVEENKMHHTVEDEAVEKLEEELNVDTVQQTKLWKSWKRS